MMIRPKSLYRCGFPRYRRFNAIYDHVQFQFDQQLSAWHDDI